MLDYEYTQVNRLDFPHKYMYTTYHGMEFVNIYFRSRLDGLKRFRLQSNQVYINQIDLYFCTKSTLQLKELLNKENILKNLLNDFTNSLNLREKITPSIKNDIKKLELFNLENTINTDKLLSSLIFNQIHNKSIVLVKLWLDRLVQRFEVTKKLYTSYQSGFRICQGKTDILHIYWLFSLLLILFYAKTKNTKYLSTLLKVTDLLLSLNNKLLVKDMPMQGLLLVLSYEILSINSLLSNIKEGGFVFE